MSLRNTIDFGRRELLRTATASLFGVASCSWFPQIATALANDKQRRRHCVLLWMGGGPSQIDTFDMKPGHTNGGEFKEIATAVPGLRISEHLPGLAAHANQLSIVRSVSTKEGDHGRGTYLMRTGQRPGTGLRYPTLGSSLSKVMGDESARLPNYVAVNPSPQVNPDAFGPGFLGPKYAAATVGAVGGQRPDGEGDGDVGFANLRVQNLRPPANIESAQLQRRQKLWQTMQKNFLAERSAPAAVAHNTVYERAIRMMNSEEVEAFELNQEADEIRERYGRGRFGQGCLVARRLIERGVPFVEVTLGDGIGWDTHQNNFDLTRNLSEQLDKGWSTLMTELADRGLLQDTTILWMGEFGRTPQINNMGGRDHFPAAWSCVFAGGGVQGGSVYGQTSDDGAEVTDGKVNEADILATLCGALGVDPEHEHVSDLGRPIKITEGTPIQDILA